MIPPCRIESQRSDIVEFGVREMELAVGRLWDRASPAARSEFARRITVEAGTSHPSRPEGLAELLGRWGRLPDGEQQKFMDMIGVVPRRAAA